MADTEAHCAFCRRDGAEVWPMVAGHEGYICADCARLAYDIVLSWEGRRSELPDVDVLPTPHSLHTHMDAHVVGQEEAKEILAIAVHNHYKRLRSETDAVKDSQAVELGKSNILLLGPSGSGKTLLLSTLARNVDVPFVVADATTLTQTGYVGEDVESLLARLVEAADGHVGRAEWGIVYVDELDKLAGSTENATGTRDVAGEGVQQALLKLVEGAQVRVPLKGRRQEGGEEVTLDTSRILFIGGGAFSGLESIVRGRLGSDAGGMGFFAAPGTGGVTDEGQDAATDLAEVEPEDLRRFGLIPELVGRFPVTAVTRPLGRDELISILTEPREALIKQYQRLFALDGVDLEVAPEALGAIAEQARQHGTGARGLRGILERVLRRAMYELPARGDVRACVLEAAPETEADNGLELRFVLREGEADRSNGPAALTGNAGG